MFKKWAWPFIVLGLLGCGLALADSSTTNLLLTNQTTGGNPNTWGDIADENFETIDEKLGDVQAISTTGGDTTLSTSQEIVNALSVTGTLVSNATLTFSGRGGTWLIRNATTGSFTVTAKTSGNTGVEIPQGTTKLIYCCISSDIAATSQPSAKSPGEVFAYAGASCPDESLQSYGQAISRTTYADLFAIVGTTYGVGDGSTTFNTPDMRGRAIFGQDDMGGSSANRLTDAEADSLNGDTLADTGGVETQTISSAEMPSHTHTGPSHTHSVSGTSGAGSSHSHSSGSYALTDTSIDNGSSVVRSNGLDSLDNAGSGDTAFSTPPTVSTLSLNDSDVTGTSGTEASHTHSFSATSGADGTGATGSAGSSEAVAVVPPAIILNYCIYTGV